MSELTAVEKGLVAKMGIYIGLGIAVILIVLCIYLYISLYNRLRKLHVKVEEGSSGIDVALEKRYDLLSEELEAVKKYLKHEQETYTAVASIRARKELDEKMLEKQGRLSEEAIKTIDEQISSQTEKMNRIKRQIEQHKNSGGRKQNPQKQEMKKTAFEEGTPVYQTGVNQKVNMLASLHKDLNGVGSVVDALSEQYPVLYSSLTMDYFQKTIYDSEEHLQAARRLYNSNVSLYNQLLVTIPYTFIAGIHGMEKADFYEIPENKKNYTIKFD